MNTKTKVRNYLLTSIRKKTALQIANACKIQVNTAIKNIKHLSDGGLQIEKGWKEVINDDGNKVRIRTYWVDCPF
jgi:TnpA family transposase